MRKMGKFRDEENVELSSDLRLHERVKMGENCNSMENLKMCGNVSAAAKFTIYLQILDVK